MAEIKHEVVTLYEEPCDCLDKHGRILHDNGGNYHRVVRVHTFAGDDGSWCAVVEDTDTRERFPRDIEEYLVRDGKYGGYKLVTEHEHEWLVEAGGYDFPIIARFRDMEARIIA